MATAAAGKKIPQRAPPCEEFDQPYDIKLVFVQKITFVLRKINKTPLPPKLHFLIPICTKIDCRLGLRPRPHWWSLQRSPGCILGAYF